MREDYRERLLMFVGDSLLKPNYFIPITKVVEEPCDIDYDQDGMYADLKRANDFSFTIQAKIKQYKGIMDVMTGKDTPAARRCIRHDKRMKEKRRRNRLKYGK